MGDRQKLGLGGLVLLGFLVSGYIGARFTRQPADIAISQSEIGEAIRAAPTSGEQMVVVQIAGEVKKPGLYKLPPGSRIDDAVKAAGGLSADADETRLNLAQRVSDEMKIQVPAVGDESSEPVILTNSPNTALAATGPAPSQNSKGAVQPQSPGQGSISINNASESELDSLPGVGPATAAKIIQYRSAKGGFHSIDELMNVSGIGPKKMERIRPFVRL